LTLQVIISKLYLNTGTANASFYIIITITINNGSFSRGGYGKSSRLSYDMISEYPLELLFAF